MGHRRTGTDLSIYMAVTSKMNQVTAFSVVVNIGNIWRKYFLSALFSILPFLTYGHLIGIDLIPDASGVAFPLWIPLRIALLSPAAVIKEHNVAIGKNLTGVLPVAPFQSLIVCAEKVPVRHLLRPAFRVAQNPVDLSCLKVEIDDGILISAGQAQTVCLLIVPHRVIMEPVVSVLILADGSRSHGQDIF